MTETTAPRVDAGLRRGVMGSTELFAQAIANIAPSAVIAFTAAAIFVSAGKGTWLSFLLATIIILAVGYAILQFAKRRASAGSLYNYAAIGLGPGGAYVTGVTLIIGCFCIAAASLSGAVSYTMLTVTQLGLPLEGLFTQIVVAFVLGSLATFFTIRGIRVSARVSFVLELLSIGIIVLLFVLTLAYLGPAAWDPSQFDLSQTSFSGVAAGMVLAILGFVGFSSADALGREAKNPFRAIPRAIMWSALGVGVLYIFGAYTQVAALGDGLGASASPLDDIAVLIGMPTWFNPILNGGVAASFFAVVVAPLNVIGRILYVMGKEGVVDSRLGWTHEQYQTPHRALLIAGGAVVLVPTVFYLLGVDPISVLVWVNTFGTYGYMVAYGVIAIAALVYVRRIGVVNRLLPFAVLVAVGGMAYVFWSNIVPVPAFPFNIIPWLFALLFGATMVWFAFLARRRPAVVAAIGTTETDLLEGVG